MRSQLNVMYRDVHINPREGAVRICTRFSNLPAEAIRYVRQNITLESPLLEVKVPQ